MNFFRRILGSKIGGFIAVAFLAVIAGAFILSDINGSRNFHVFGPATGEVASVGGKTVTVNDLQTRAQLIFERLREDDANLTMDKFLADGGLRRVADEMIASKAVIAYGEKHGMRVSKALIDAEIASNPAFVDATGNFSETVFRQLLAQRRITEKDFREDITAQIIQQQILAPVGAGARAPGGMVPPYAAMLIEQRSGEMFGIPSAMFAPKTPPTEAELKAYYTANPGQFTVPEQRKLRYALVSLSRFEGAAAPTDVELAQAYKNRAAQYKARQTRDFSQLILATESAAKDAAAKVKAGQALTDVAKGLGLSASRLVEQDESKLTLATSAEVAKAASAAAKGTVLGPYRLPLGWTVLRVEDVHEIPGKTLDQAKAELAPEIHKIKMKQAFSAFLGDIDGKLGGGASFAEVAKASQLTIAETPFLLKDGRDLKNVAYKADPAVTAMLQQGFSMTADDDPQVVAIKPDEEAAIVQVGDIVPAGPPPFEEVKAAVQVAWGLSKGSEKAKQLATQLAAELSRGADADATLAKLGLAGAQRQPLAARRADINREGGKIPPPLATLFTITPGVARMLPLENNQGFLVVKLEKIIPEDPTKVPQLMTSTQAGLGNVLGSEYVRQLMAAIQQDMGVQRNEAAIASVEQALRQANGSAGQ